MLLRRNIAYESVFSLKGKHHGSELVVEKSFKKGPCQIYLVQSIKLSWDMITIACLCISRYPEESVNTDVLWSVRARFWRCRRSGSCRQQCQDISSFACSPLSPWEDALLRKRAACRGLLVANKVVRTCD